MLMNIIKSKETERKTYRLLIKNEDSLPSITVIDKDNSNSYFCQINEEDIEKFSQILEIPASQYKETLLKLFTLKPDKSTAFVDIVNDELLLYKSKLLKYFSKDVKQINHVETLHTCINCLHNENSENNDEITKLSAHNEGLQTELLKYKEKLDECIDNASERENRLYSCFIQVLNEKKRRLQYLQNFTNGNVQGDDEPKDRNRNKRRYKEISDSDSNSGDTNYNTDDEKVENTIKKGNSNVAPGTSSSKASSSKSTSTNKSTTAVSLFDESMETNILDSDSDDDHLFFTALPRRQQREVDSSVTSKVLTQTQGENEPDVPEIKVLPTPVKSQDSKSSLPDTPVETFSTQDLIDGI